MLKKLIIGVVIALAILWGIYGYFLYAGDPSILRNWILTHPRQTIVFFVSIVALYMLQWGNKIAKFLTIVLIFINIFFVWDLFFRNNIGLNSQQFLVLFGLILLALAITYISHWVRYIFMGIVGIGIVFVLLTGILPMYENIPSISDFVQSQKTKIINQWANSDGILVIKNALWTKEIPVNELDENDIDLSQTTQISFVSKTTKELEKIFVDLGNGSFININPQSAITLQQSWDATVMQILQGNIEYYIPEEFSWALQIIGKYTGKSVESGENTIRSNLVQQFEQKKESFFINQIGGNLLLNPAIDKVIKFFINTLYSISPKTYQNNLANYNNIQKYFGKTTTGEENTVFTGESLKSMINDIWSQAKRWAEETKINEWFNN